MHKPLPSLPQHAHFPRTERERERERDDSPTNNSVHVHRGVMMSMSLPGQQQPQQETEELRRRLEKLSRNYDVDTMKVFMVVEALGERSLHAVYSDQRKLKWQSFLQRREACRLDLARHEKTRERYHQFLNEVGREEQRRQWFQAVVVMLNQLGAADIFNYISNHANSSANTTTTTNRNYCNDHNHSPRRHDPLRHQHNTQRQRETDIALIHNHHHHSNNDHHKLPLPYHHHHHHLQTHQGSHNSKGLSLLPEPSQAAGAGNNHNHHNSNHHHHQHHSNNSNSGFCAHLAKLFEKKLEAWFDSFQAVAARLTAHVKVSGLVRVLSGQVHALGTRQGRLHAVVIRLTAQDTPRPLDVAELCLAKVMVIQNGLALPEDLGLALLALHVHPARPVLRLWVLNPSVEMEAAIRLADIDDMIDAGRLSQHHELWADNTTTDTTTTTTTTSNGGDNVSVDNNVV